MNNQMNPPDGTGNLVASAELNFDHSRLSLAMAYVLMQPQITKVYKPEDALRQGTLFPDLDKPFFGYGGCVK